MTGLGSGSDRAGGITTGIARELVLMILGLRSSRLDARSNVGPCASIQRLFLKIGV